MVKSDLILRLAERHKHLVQKDAEIAVNLIVDAMIDALAQGRRIEIREFGSFTLRERKARKARNPRTGEGVDVPKKAHIYFRPTGQLKRRVQAAVSVAPEIENLPLLATTKAPRPAVTNKDLSAQEIFQIAETLS